MDNTTTQHTEVIARYLGVINELNDLDKYWSTAKARKEEMETRLADVLHFIEELDYYNVQLTANQCKKLIDLIKDLRQIRRGYKKEEILHDTMESNKAKLGYENQRSMLISEMCRKEKSLQTTYNPRILKYEDIFDMITSTGGRGRKPKNRFVKENNENND